MYSYYHLLLFGLFILSIAISYKQDRILSQTPYGGILSFEFKYGVNQIRTTVNDWDMRVYKSSNLKEYARRVIYFDFIFILIYVTFLFSFNAVYSDRANLAMIATDLALAAGALDTVENSCMLQHIDGKIGIATIGMKLVAVYLKFVCFGISVWILVSNWLRFGIRFDFVN